MLSVYLGLLNLYLMFRYLVHSLSTSAYKHQKSDIVDRIDRGFEFLESKVEWLVGVNVVLFLVAFNGIFVSWNHSKVL